MTTKQFMTSLMAATALCGTASAQTLRIADVEALPGETVAFALTIDVEGGAYSGFQFQMRFPSEGFSTTGTTVVPEWDGASFGVGDLDANGEANGSAFSTSDTAIPDGEREIGTVKFTVADGVALGDYPVTISGFNFLDGNIYIPLTADVTFTVHVVNVHSVVLNETAVMLPVEQSNVSVRVKRTIKAGEWSTICLPFAMTEEQVKGAFGSDVQIGDFNDYEFDGDAISVKFNAAAAIEANHPYVIKVTADVAEFTVDGVDIDPQEAVVDFDTSRRKNQPRQMVGTYVANTVLDWGTLFLSGNQFWYSTGNTKMKAFRAYFNFYDLLPDFEDNYESRQVKMLFGDNSTTGIKGVEDGKLKIEDSVYDLQGRRVASSTFDSQSSIQKKGIYVKEGKKVVIK